MILPFLAICMIEKGIGSKPETTESKENLIAGGDAGSEATWQYSFIEVR